MGTGADGRLLGGGTHHLGAASSFDGRNGGASAGARQPRVLFVSYTSDWTGPTNSLLHLLRGLRDRFDCTVLIPGSGAYEQILSEEGVPYHRIPSLRKTAIPSMVRLFRQGRYDLIYANNTSSSSENALIAAKLCRLPVLCHIRGIRRTSRLRRLAFLRFTDATIAVSHACAQANRRFTPAGASYVVHNGVDVDRFRADRVTAREQLLHATGLDDSAVIVVSVGNVTHRKGYHLGVEIVARLATADSPAHLVIAGDPDLRPEYTSRLRSMAAEASLGTHVHLLGFRHDVPLLLQGADAYLHTALTDPHPRAVLEAMAARLPAVAFATDGVAESIVDGETGYLVPTGDVDGAAAALDRLVRDAALRRRLGEAGRAHVSQEFSDRTTARKVGDVIDGVLARRGLRGDR
jgi:glycosyltransferase involved in cell wall biosynthesis